MECMLLDHRDRWTEALRLDFGKPPFEQEFAILVPLGQIAYYQDNLNELMASKEIEIPQGLAETGHSGVIYREPFGVTLMIGPRT